MKADDIIGAVEDVTKKWTKQRKREERDRTAAHNRRQAMVKPPHVSIKAAAWSVMEAAYMKASAGGTLPALARQIMYVARPKVQELASGDLSSDFDKYFTQQLLPDYIKENGCDWDVLYDERGHFSVPHTRGNVPLGTLKVREYLEYVEKFNVPEPKFDISEAGYPTRGPKDRYGAILFIEKEGFAHIFAHAKIAERYDIAIMSTKGVSNTASRELVDRLSKFDIPLFVLHDFDKNGFTIVGTLRRDTRRYKFGKDINVIDLGLRMNDIEGLETEFVYHKDSLRAVAANLTLNGATKEEIEFLMERRVELNALTSDQLVEFIERKLTEHSVEKVIPNDDTLAAAYRRARRQALVQQRINEALAEFDGKEADKLEVPADLRVSICKSQGKRRELRWDSIVAHIAKEDHERARKSEETPSNK